MAPTETSLFKVAGDKKHQTSPASYGSFEYNQGFSTGKELDVSTGNGKEAGSGDSQANSTGSKQNNSIKPSHAASSAQRQDVVIIPQNPNFRKKYRAKLRCKCSSTKTNITQGLLNCALMTAHGIRLRTVLKEGNSHPNFFLLMVLIHLSVWLQIVAGVLMVYICSNDVNNDQLHEENNKLSTVVVILVFLATAIYVTLTIFVP